MGLDFCAIAEYPNFDSSILEFISSLETNALIPAFEEMRAVAIEQDQHTNSFGQSWSWISERHVGDHVLQDHQQKRPKLPCSDFTLRTSAGFELTFGPKLVKIYHPLRWSIFSRDQKWQDATLRALKYLTNNLNTTRCVISHDCSAVISDVEQRSLKEAIDVAVNEWNQYETDKFSDVERMFNDPSPTDPNEKRYEFNGFVRFI